MKLPVCFLCISLAFIGCASVHPEGTSHIAAWTQQHGGEVCDARLERVRGIAGTLPAQVNGHPIQLHVLQSDAVVAYSWPSGEVFLSAGLVNIATDDEIAAAIAHELGHLLNDAPGRDALSLRGGGGSLEIEASADATGAKLLATTGHSAMALNTLLWKVRAASNSVECRSEISERIKRLTAH